MSTPANPDNGAMLSTALYFLIRSGFVSFIGSLEMGGWMVVITVLASFIAMNFTGASTYTSLSGVYKEMKLALPLQKAAAVAGIGLWLAGRLLES